MLNLKANNHNLIIPDNVKIAITSINPMVVRNRGSNSLNFGLSGINRKFLEAPHLPGIKRLNELDVEVSFRSYKKNAKLFFESLSKNQYSCRINIDESTFYEQFGSKSIRDLELGGARNYEDYTNNPGLFHKSSYESDFVIVKLHNEKFMNGTMHEADYQTNNKYQNNNSYVPFFDTKTPRTPFIYLCYLYEELFQENGYLVKFNHLREDSHFRKLVLYTNQSADYASFTFYLAKHLPDITIVDLINAISDTFNIHPIINENTKEVFLVSLEQKLRIAKIIDITQYASDNLTKTGEDLTTKVVFKMGVETNDENQSPHKFLYDQLDLNIKDQVSTYANLPPGDEAGSIRLVEDINWYYRHEVDTSGVYSWEKFTINIQVVEIGTGENKLEISPAISAVQINSGSYASNPEMVMMEGNTLFRMSPKKIPLLIGFFHNADGGYGLWNNSGEADEIFLTPESLFDYCFKNTANMWINSFQPYECTLRFPAAILNSFDFSSLYKIRDTIFLIEENNYNLEVDKITYEKSKLRAI